MPHYREYRVGLQFARGRSSPPKWICATSMAANFRLNLEIDFAPACAAGIHINRMKTVFSGGITMLVEIVADAVSRETWRLCLWRRVSGGG